MWMKHDISYNKKICILRNQSKTENENILYDQNETWNIGVGREPCNLSLTLMNVTKWKKEALVLW